MDFVIKQGLLGTPPTPLSTSFDVYKDKNMKVNDILDKLSETSYIIRSETIVCSDETKRCANTIDGAPLYVDDNHPSPLYSNLIADSIVDHLLETSKSKPISASAAR